MFNFLEYKIYAISINKRGKWDNLFSVLSTKMKEIYNFVIARLPWIPAASDYSRPQDNDKPVSRQGCHKGLGCPGKSTS